MTDTILALLPTYGMPLFTLIVMLSCVGFPIPGSLALLIGGALAAEDEMSLIAVLAFGLGGALIGDQIGYWIGKVIGDPLEARLSRKPKREKQVLGAKALLRRWGGVGVYFSRWLVAPLGPVINLLAGMSDMRWWRFSLFDLLGETTWVGLYVGMGYFLAGNLMEIAGILSDIGWMLAGLVIAGILGARLMRVHKSHG